MRLVAAQLPERVAVPHVLLLLGEEPLGSNKAHARARGRPQLVMQFKALRAAAAAATRAQAVTTTSELPPLTLHVNPDTTEATEFDVAGVPRATYKRNVLSETDAALVIKWVDATHGWQACKNRSLLNLGGIPSPDGMIAEPLPAWLHRLASELGLRVNQALINRYDATGSISRHQDGPNYEPEAHILSLDGSAVLYFAKDRTSAPFGSILLEPRSLLSFSAALYVDAFHFIVPAVDGAELIPGNPAPANVSDPPHSITRLERVSITMRWAHLASKQAQDYLDADELRREIDRRRTWWSKAVGDG